MQLFVESWKPVLRHLGGILSIGHAAVHSKRGSIVPYSARGQQLYIHFMDVDSIDDSDLKPHVDQTTGRVNEGRRSPPNVEWWLSSSPTAYAVVDGHDGSQSVRARISQLRNPYRISST